MGKYDNQTPVLFRKWKPRREFDEEGGDIIALFPTELGTNNPYTSSSYEHIGQHGSADPLAVVWATVPAKPSEYADLKAELESRGYDDLKVYQRLQYDFLTERMQKLVDMGSQIGGMKPRVAAKAKPKTKKRTVSKRMDSGMTSVRGIRR